MRVIVIIITISLKLKLNIMCTTQYLVPNLLIYSVPAITFHFYYTLASGNIRYTLLTQPIEFKLVCHLL